MKGDPKTDEYIGGGDLKAVQHTKGKMLKPIKREKKKLQIGGGKELRFCRLAAHAPVRREKGRFFKSFVDRGKMLRGRRP